MSSDSNSAYGNDTGHEGSTPERRSSYSRSGQELSSYAYYRAENSPFPPTRQGTALEPTTSFPPPSRPNVSTQAASIQQPGTAEWGGSSSLAHPPLEGLLQKWHEQIRRSFSDQVTPLRLASHFSVLMVAALVLIFSRIEMPSWNISLRTFASGPIGGEVAPDVSHSLVSTLADTGGVTAPTNVLLQRATVPFTVVHEKKREADSYEIQTYVVQPGDTVVGIAEKFGLQPETIQWSNPSIEVNPDIIRPGDTLKILPIDGAIHTVSPGDTLSSLAAKYKISVEDILNYPGNGLTDPNAPLVVGTQLVMPGGTKPYSAPYVVAYEGAVVPGSATKGSGAFVWPTSGSITQRYWGGHAAIDIGSWTGAPVKAADSGYVAVARGGWNAGYGNHVIIDHGNGFVTLYAHLSSIYVRPGENVVRGQQVGAVGNTGNSTGPHLHFEIRYQGVPRNPLSYLP
ncbi:M23 family metallopeptidase [Litorilinea aerophila]|nr:peptidoglycan DD-metalloendopeptidase family protein [Litorilinea aerophila]MCC9078851.1 M23 family metallopeptidase [Litorilinea aerophila]GIV78754.1 MAG: hypothetical protein KatS3mg050_3148 [Litorilinea sp.]